MNPFIWITVFVFTLFAGFLPATEIMPLSEVREGMKGVGKTVFKGDQIEEFEVEILGVLRNYLPQQNLILGILKGHELEETGVIAGMSGSPVFVDGKMIGAVAYSWPFAKLPIAGITPIESMLQTEASQPEPPAVTPPIEVAQYYNFESLLTSHFQQIPSIQATHPAIGKIQLTPIAAPLTVSGFDPRVIDRFTPLFQSLGLQPVQGGAAVGSDPGSFDTELRPGAPVSVQLIQGDFDIGAIGTVTYRSDKKVLAFGHPFFNLGPINFPMATAKIYAVVPSLFSSFKVGAGGPVVGAVKQDLHAAIFGILGDKSSMIPIKVYVKNGAHPPRKFEFQIADHKLVTPVLLDFAFQNSILVTQLGFSESTLRISGSIDIKDASPVSIQNIFSGAGSFTNASQYVASILYALMTNDFKNVEVKGIDIEVESTMQRKEAELLEVWVDRNEARPGEEIKLKVMFRPMHGEIQTEEFSMRIPDDAQFRQLQFVIGGGQEISRQEYALYGKTYRPDNLDQMISLLNSLRSNDRIYVKAFTQEPTLVVKGQFLNSLPSSVYSVLSSSQTIGSSQKISRMALWEDSRSTEYYITGIRMFSIGILPGQN